MAHGTKVNPKPRVKKNKTVTELIAERDRKLSEYSSNVIYFGRQSARIRYLNNYYAVKIIEAEQAEQNAINNVLNEVKIMQTIYIPRGAAREYGALALNIYQGCAHDCAYCYVPGMPQWRGKSREQFVDTKVRYGMIESLDRDAAKRQARGETGQVFLCFTCDPWQPLESERGITRAIINLLHHRGFYVNALTKAGALPLRDLDLFGAADSFGITLTTTHDATARKWERGASSPSERIETLRAFHAHGIDTWVSFEPVLNPDWTLRAIEAAAPFVRRVKIGKWNHDKRANAIDWRKFRADAEALCKRLSLEYMLKADLLEATQ